MRYKCDDCGHFGLTDYIHRSKVIPKLYFSFFKISDAHIETGDEAMVCAMILGVHAKA